MPPTPLNDKSADDPVDRRRALARWLTSGSNPWLARNVVNRYWGYLMGKGLVNPIDDLRAGPTPVQPRIARRPGRRVWQTRLRPQKPAPADPQQQRLSACCCPGDPREPARHPHSSPIISSSRLTAEQLLDAINFATGTTEKFDLKPLGTRAIALPDTSVKSYFLDTFGRPLRVLACECERSADPNLSQALNLMNGDVVNRKVADPSGRLARWMADPKIETDETLVRNLYLVTFQRPATPDEVVAARALIAPRLPAPLQVTRPGLRSWGLLNSKDFVFNHCVLDVNDRGSDPHGGLDPEPAYRCRAVVGDCLGDVGRCRDRRRGPHVRARHHSRCSPVPATSATARRTWTTSTSRRAWPSPRTRPPWRGPASTRASGRGQCGGERALRAAQRPGRGAADALADSAAVRSPRARLDPPLDRCRGSLRSCPSPPRAPRRNRHLAAPPGG